MDKKILEALEKKFPATRKDVLIHIANTLAMVITAEDQIATTIEGVKSEQVTDIEKKLRSSIDTEITTSLSTQEANLKKKFDFVEKQEDKGGKEKPVEVTAETLKDPATLLAAIGSMMSEAIKPIADKVSLIEQGAITGSRKSKLEEAIKEAPDSFKETIKNSFNMMSFKEDADFNTYLQVVTDNAKKLQEEAKNARLGNQGFPIYTGGNPSTEATDADVEEIASKLVNK